MTTLAIILLACGGAALDPADVWLPWLRPFATKPTDGAIRFPSRWELREMGVEIDVPRSPENEARRRQLLEDAEMNRVIREATTERGPDAAALRCDFEPYWVEQPGGGVAYRTFDLAAEIGALDVGDPRHAIRSNRWHKSVEPI